MRRVVTVVAALMVTTVGGAIAGVGPAVPSLLAAAAPSPVWNVVPSPSPQSAAAGSLQGVTCPTATNCVAVGAYRYGSTPGQPFVGRSNGTSWDLVPAPAPTDVADQKYATGRLLGVACATAAKCFGVGNYDDGVHKRTLIEQWDGARWTIVSRLRPSSATSSVLSDVTCPTTTTCLAVGAWRSADGRNRSFVARWERQDVGRAPEPECGRRALRQPAPRRLVCERVELFRGRVLRPGQSARLDVDPAVGRQDVVARGEPQSGDRARQRTLRTSRACRQRCAFAVGSAHNGANKTAPYKTLVERWNGKRWSITASPNPPASHFVALNGISCSASDSCFAVGALADKTAFYNLPLIERWNGRTLVDRQVGPFPRIRSR